MSAEAGDEDDADETPGGRGGRSQADRNESQAALDKKIEEFKAKMIKDGKTKSADLAALKCLLRRTSSRRCG